MAGRSIGAQGAACPRQLGNHGRLVLSMLSVNQRTRRLLSSSSAALITPHPSHLNRYI